jgi:hypothetical protein
VWLVDQVSFLKLSDGDDSKCLKKPNDDTNHHHEIQDFLYFTVHRQIIVDQPKQKSDYDYDD